MPPEAPMSGSIERREVTKENLSGTSCCGIKNPVHEGHKRKTDWIRAHLDNGLRILQLLDEDGDPFGFIEYLPGEYAWRGIEARGYLFIHCLWISARKYQGKGFASQLIREVIDDAKKRKMTGVAATAREGPWLAGNRIFLKNGFKIVDTAPPDHELLALKLAESAPDPKFKGDWDRKLARYGSGLTLVHSAQCPHIAKFANDIAEFARTAYLLKPRIVELNSYREAQNAPTPYAVFAVIYDGRLLADHQISRTRFRNIMDGILKPKASHRKGSAARANRP